MEFCEALQTFSHARAFMILYEKYSSYLEAIYLSLLPFSDSAVLPLSSCSCGSPEKVLWLELADVNLRLSMLSLKVLRNFRSWFQNDVFFLIFVSIRSYQREKFELRSWPLWKLRCWLKIWKIRILWIYLADKKPQFSTCIFKKILHKNSIIYSQQIKAYSNTL